MGKILMTNPQPMMKKIQAFLISKFLKFYGEELEKEQIN